MLPIVCLVSDFGLDDTWVGVCHAAIMGACPDARVVDLAHGIAPFDIRAGAVVAASGVFQLPEAIHIVAVDPGVGGDRRDVCVLTTAGTHMIGPDNGVLIPATEIGGGVAEAYELPPMIGALATFHARDVFAPAAALLACGATAASIWPRISSDSLVSGPFELCTVRDGYVHGEVVGTDRFGSLRLNIPSERLTEYGLEAERLEIALGHNVLDVPMGRTFSTVGEGNPVALADSSGWLTLAVNRGNAADRYGVEAGTHVRIRSF